MRSVWCLVVAVCLCAAGGRVRASEAHVGASELHAAVAAVHVAARHVTPRRVSAPVLPCFTSPARDDLAPPRLAILAEGAPPARLVDLARATPGSARGPPRS